MVYNTLFKETSKYVYRENIYIFNFPIFETLIKSRTFFLNVQKIFIILKDVKYAFYCMILFWNSLQLYWILIY